MNRLLPTLLGLCVGLTVFGFAGPDPVRAQLPDEFTNLKVFPEDIAPRNLIGAMRSFSQGLGVRCTHCHVGEEGQPFSEYDFASDDKPAKRKARFMLEMSMQLNDEILPGLSQVADRREPGVRVQCVTCHRGVAVPRQIEEVITQTISDAGTAAGIAKYRELREEYYGQGAYNFGEQALIRTTEALGEDYDSALAVLALALEYFPESVQAWVGSAQAHQAKGDIDAARAALLEAQELAPDSPQIARMLERLGTP